jgi:DNA-directed RNA polymerase subunit F
MAGLKKKHADIARLKAEPELVEQIIEMAEAGVQLSKICYATGISKRALYDWQDSSPEHADLFTRARVRAAHDLVEETLEIADNADPEYVQKAKLMVTTRQWTAERWNRKDYGQAKAEVAISISGLHIEALKRRHSDEVIDVEPKPASQASVMLPPTQEELDAL